MDVDRFSVTVGGVTQAILLLAQVRTGQVTLGFLLSGFVGGLVAGTLSRPEGNPWLDGFVAGALGLGLFAGWVVALGVYASLGTPHGVLSVESFAAVTVSGWIAVLVAPFHAVEGMAGAAVADAVKRRVWAGA